MGEGDRAAQLFSLINPIHHADTPEKMNRYRVEPYVIAADVYSASPHAGRGGRAQDLALQVAERIDGVPSVCFLAAGTDGRDGNSDAAGAVVDATTWDAVRAVGRDPADDLAEHRSFAALDAVGALIRTGMSGTNVGDVVVGIVEPRRPA